MTEGIASEHIGLKADVNYVSVLGDRFVQLAAADGLWHFRGLGWETDARSLPEGDELLASIAYKYDGSFEHILRLGDAIVWLRLDQGRLGGRVAVADPDEFGEAFRRIAA